MAGLSGTAPTRFLARAAATDSVYVKETAHFAVFYSKTGVHAIAGASVDLDGNGVPDNVDDVSKELERMWRLAIDTIGFPAPPGNKVEVGQTFETGVVHKVPNGKFPVVIGDMATLSSDWGPAKVFAFCTQPGQDTSYPAGMELAVDNDFINSYDNQPLQVKVSPVNSANKIDSILYDYSKRPDLGWRVKLARQFMFALEKQYDKGFYMAFHTMAAQWFAMRAYPDIHDEWQYLQKFSEIVDEPAFSYWKEEEFAEWPMAKAMADVYGDKFMKEIWDYRNGILVSGNVIDEGTWFHNVLMTLGKNEEDFNRHFIRMATCLKLNLSCSEEFFGAFDLANVDIRALSFDSVELTINSGVTVGGAFQVSVYRAVADEMKNGWNFKGWNVTATSSSAMSVVCMPSQKMDIVKPVSSPYVFNMTEGDTALYFSIIGGYDGVTQSDIVVGTTKAPLSTGISAPKHALMPETAIRLDLQGRPVSGAHRGITVEFVPGQGWVRKLKLAR